MMTVNEVIDLIRSADSPDQIRTANQAQSDFVKSGASAEDIEAVRQAQSETINTMLDRIEQERQPALRYLALNGTQYDFNDWLTISEYARRFGLKSPNNVTAWIMRGIIPTEDTLEVPELNGLRLVRNRVYKETSTEVGS